MKRGLAGRYRLGLSVSLICSVALAISGCGQGGAGTTNQGATSQSTTTITVTDYNAQAALKPVIDNFEKAYPNVKVEEQYIDPTAYSPALITSLQAGNASDVFATNGGTGQQNSVLPLAQAGYLSDLSKQPLMQGFPSIARDLYTVGGKVYGLPMSGDVAGIIYNKDMFKQLDLAVPSTFSQLVALCTKVKSAGKIPMAISGMNAGFYIFEPSGNTVYSQAPNWNDLRKQNKVTFAGTQGWRTALDQFVALKNGGCFEPGAAGDTLPQAFNQMASGQAAMFVAPDAAVGAIRGISTQLQPGIFPFPAAKAADTRTVIAYNSSYSVNAKSKHVAEALKFVNFLARTGQDRLWVQGSGGVAIDDLKVAKLPSYDAPVVPLVKANKTVSLPYLTWQGSTFSDLGPALQGVLTGQKTEGDVLQTMDRSWQKSG